MIDARAKLPRSARLSGAVHFTGQFDARRQGRHFTVLVRRRSSGTARLGVVAGRHGIPAAVDRSRMKRMVREVFRVLRPRLGSIDVIVRIRQAAAGQGLAVARGELEALLHAVH
ncbi:MAG TPA: ribonuclease P protein component [Burkholderiales bacterium]|nr:ribonuclease P protein component [Burkholderiales bacterium]